MEKYYEMIARLTADGMRADNPPVGFLGGPRLGTLNGIRMRCKKATLLAQMDGEQLVDFDFKLPYGFLHVEAPELRVFTIVAVTHKLDFWNAWVLNERGVFEDADCEVHLIYKRASGLRKALRGIFPHFEFMVFNPGLFEGPSQPECSGICPRRKTITSTLWP